MEIVINPSVGDDLKKEIIPSMLQMAKLPRVLKVVCIWSDGTSLMATPSSVTKDLLYQAESINKR